MARACPRMPRDVIPCGTSKGVKAQGSSGKLKREASATSSKVRVLAALLPAKLCAGDGVFFFLLGVGMGYAAWGWDGKIRHHHGVKDTVAVMTMR